MTSPTPVDPSTERPSDAAPPSGRGRGSLALRIFAWFHRLAERGWATTAVAGWAFLQASIVPGLVDSVIIPLGLADPPRAFRFAWAATLGSVAGTLITWSIGVFAFESIGLPLLALVGVDAARVTELRPQLQQQGWWIILVGTWVPISIKALGIAAGAVGVPLPIFASAILVGRGLRFLVVALVVRFAGDRVERWVERKYGKTLHQLAEELKRPSAHAGRGSP